MSLLLRKNYLPPLGAGLLLLFFLALMLSEARQKSAHFDETAHLFSGYFMTENSDYRIGTSNLVLSQKLAALPLKSIEINAPSPKLMEACFKADQIHGDEAFILGYDFLNKSGNRSSTLLFLGRLGMIFCSLLAAIAVFLWSKSIFGYGGALLSLSLYVACPSILGIGFVIGADAPANLFFILSAWALWNFLDRITPFSICALGFSCGALALTKMSCLVFIIYAFILLCARVAAGSPVRIGWTKSSLRVMPGRIKILRSVLTFILPVFFLVWTIVWAGYGFRFSAASPDFKGNASLSRAKLENQSGCFEATIKYLLEIRAFPEAYLLDFANLRSLTSSSKSFFLGETRSGGTPSYFPFMLFAKMSVPAFLAILTAIIFSVTDLKYLKSRSFNGDSPRCREKLYQCIPVLLFVAVYMGIAVFQKMNIGHRHILPVFSFLYIFAGYAWDLEKLQSKFSRIFLLLLPASALASALLLHPAHLAYVSPFCGGPYKAYQLFTDSALEWGQELPALEKWLEKNQESFQGQNLYLSYFGSASPSDKLSSVKRLPGYLDPRSDRSCQNTVAEKLKPGVYCISATMLQPSYYTREGAFFPATSFCGEWSEEMDLKYKSMTAPAEALIDAIAEAKSKPEAEHALKKWFMENHPPELSPADSGKYWMEFLAAYDLARFAKLASALRSREADAQVNYSYYIFILDEKELAEILAD